MSCCRPTEASHHRLTWPARHNQEAKKRTIRKPIINKPRGKEHTTRQTIHHAAQQRTNSTVHTDTTPSNPLRHPCPTRRCCCWADEHSAWQVAGCAQLRFKPELGSEEGTTRVMLATVYCSQHYQLRTAACTTSEHYHCSTPCQQPLLPHSMRGCQWLQPAALVHCPCSSPNLPVDVLHCLTSMACFRVCIVMKPQPLLTWVRRSRNRFTSST